MKLSFWIAGVLLCWSLTALSAEVEHRDQLKNEFASAFARSDFVQIESRYARALSTQERSPSGRFLAHAWMRAMGFADKDDPNWEAAEKKTRKWVAQYPKSVLAVIAHSRIHRSRAWNARGRDYASTVTEEGWKKFALHMNRATEALASRAECHDTVCAYSIGKLSCSDTPPTTSFLPCCARAKGGGRHDADNLARVCQAASARAGSHHG
jgi:hypothetical protein